MALRRKLVIEDRIEVVGDLIVHPFIYTFNVNSPPDFLGKLVIATKPENERMSICAPKEILKIQINRELAEKVDPTRETRKPIEFTPTGAETIENGQLSPGCLVIDPLLEHGTSAKLCESICGFQKRTGRFNGDAYDFVEQNNRTDTS